VSKFFKPTGETAKKIAAIVKEAERIKGRGIALMKRVGAKAVRSPQRNYELVGFEFDEPPDPKLWKHSKRNGWVPKATNAAVLAEMKECRHDTYGQIAKVIGFNIMHITADDGGFYIESFGWTFEKKTKAMILEVPDRLKALKGCERIADVEVEATCMA
jgi:hypothetical protein